MRLRRRLVALGAITLLLGTLSAPAFADGPVAGCGVGFGSPGTLQELWDSVDQRIYPDVSDEEALATIALFDKNGDGYMCFKHLKPNQGQDKKWASDYPDVTDYIVTLFIDNNAKGTLR